MLLYRLGNSKVNSQFLADKTCQHEFKPKFSPPYHQQRKKRARPLRRSIHHDDSVLMTCISRDDSSMQVHIKFRMVRSTINLGFMSLG